RLLLVSAPQKGAVRGAGLRKRDGWARDAEHDYLIPYLDVIRPLKVVVRAIGPIEDADHVIAVPRPLGPDERVLAPQIMPAVGLRVFEAAADLGRGRLDGGRHDKR